MNLKDIVRKGDPAADHPGLSPEEIQAMRRTVLAAVPEPRRRGWLVPVAAAAVLILAALIGLSLWRSPAPEAEAPKIAAPIPAPITPVSPPVVAVSPVSETPVYVAEKKPRSKSAGRRRPLHRNGGEGRGEGERDQIAQQQIQFSTPGGTRVIWVLNRTTE